MVKTGVSIFVLYSAFAIVSTAMNIGAQMLSILLYTGVYKIEVSILIVTTVGLPLRYFLEKHYIFAFKSENMLHDGKLFILYTFLGILTTTVFWGVEYAFHLIFKTDTMRYFGGIIGLTIGFCIKYQLDKKFVFSTGDQKVIV